MFECLTIETNNFAFEVKVMLGLETTFQGKIKKKGREWMNGRTLSLLELLITAKNPFHEYSSRSLIFFNLMKGVTNIHYIDNFDFYKNLSL